MVPLAQAYESLTFPLVIDQFIDEKVVPLLVSDGFCELTGLDRDKAMILMGAGQYDRVHPDDAGKVAQVSDDFAHHRSGYDQLVRCRHEDGYHLIHIIGHWQTMSDGTELAFMVYMDVSSSQKVIEDSSLKYLLFQQDQFYRDPLTGLPNINYMHEFADERVQALRLDGKIPMLIYSDINSMQFYNNQYGFAEGDKLLLLIARKLQKFFPDALVSRGADDHFIILDTYIDETDLNSRLIAVNNEIREEAFGNTDKSSAFPCMAVIGSEPSSFDFRISRLCGTSSTAETRYPCFASVTLYRPVPAPTSRMVGSETLERQSRMYFIVVRYSTCPCWDSSRPSSS